MPEILNATKTSSCDLAKVQIDEILAVTYYAKVKKISGEVLTLVDLERDTEFNISGKALVESMNSANQYSTEIKTTITKVVNILLHSRGNVFTVSYNKKVTEDDINGALSKINKGKILSNKEIRESVKDAYKGEERLLTGFLVGTETELGRSKAVDLNIKLDADKEYDNRVRQIDHRTINWLIVNNVKYIVKSK